MIKSLLYAQYLRFLCIEIYPAPFKAITMRNTVCVRFEKCTLLHQCA